MVGGRGGHGLDGCVYRVVVGMEALVGVAVGSPGTG